MHIVSFSPDDNPEVDSVRPVLHVERLRHRGLSPKVTSPVAAQLESVSRPFAVLCLVIQSCPTLYDLMDMDVACQAPLPMGNLQARILEWVAMPSSRGSS